LLSHCTPFRPAVQTNFSRLTARSLRFEGASKALVSRSVPCESVRTGDQTGGRRRHGHRPAGGDRKRVGHFHSVNHRFLLPELLRADHCCSTLDCPDRFAMIRWFRPAPQDIRNLFTIQRSLGHSSRAYQR
jgi:hypothetical protein